MEHLLLGRNQDKQKQNTVGKGKNRDQPEQNTGGNPDKSNQNTVTK